MRYFQNIKNKVEHSKTLERAINRSKNTTLPGFSKISIYDVLTKTWQQIKDDDIFERASAISYNFAMAFPPAIIFLFTLIPYVPISQSFINEVYTLIMEIVPGPRNYTAIIHFLDDFINNPRNDLLSVGFLLSLFFSSNAIIGVMRSFDKTLPGFTKRRGMNRRLAALKITLVLFLAFFVCIALLVARAVVLKWLGIENEFVIGLITSLRWVLILVLFFFINAYLYRSVPSIDKKWKILTPGAILSTILMALSVVIFTWWVGSFGNYNKLYGSIGVIIILMVLVYLNSLSLLLGYELNVSIHTIERKKSEQDSVMPDDAAV